MDKAKDVVLLPLTFIAIILEIIGLATAAEGGPSWQ
jgi:hypothetical protein